MKRRIIIVGGANGVRKTTFAYQYRDKYGIDYLGADEISDKINNVEKGTVQVKAGKLFFERLEEYLKQRKSVIIESTLSGQGLARRLQDFKENGYMLHFVYVFLDSADLCKNRIRGRVEKGGHNAPSVDVSRRYHRSLHNFKKLYLPMADKWIILYNGLQRPVEVAFGEGEGKMIMDEEYYNKFEELAAICFWPWR